MLIQFAQTFFDKLIEFLQSIEVSDKSGDSLDFYNGIEKFADLVVGQSKKGNKMMFIGNGASQAISSHLSTDFWKNGGIRAMAFTDPSLLTCIGNDYGYPYVFEKPVEMFADKGDILVAISSSGQSENILNACKMAKTKECFIASLSGFKEDNPLRSMGDINFYVPGKAYGPVEIIHHAILHCTLDSIMKTHIE